MDRPQSVAGLTELGRIRLSDHFFMREMLYSEVANHHGMPNVPDDPDTAVAAGKMLCQKTLEPLYRSFGHVTIRSAFRSRDLNGFVTKSTRNFWRAAKPTTPNYCADN